MHINEFLTSLAVFAQPSNIVTVNGYDYATIDNVVIEQAQVSGQMQAFELPSGWELAPAIPDAVSTARAHAWGS
jgi:hypothetical protein